MRPTAAKKLQPWKLITEAFKSFLIARCIFAAAAAAAAAVVVAATHCGLCLLQLMMLSLCFTSLAQGNCFPLVQQTKKGFGPWLRLCGGEENGRGCGVWLAAKSCH